MSKEKNLSEKEIRPADLLEGQVTAMNKDIENLLCYINDFVNVDCPACNGKQTNYLYEKYNLNYVECSECGTIFINPRPSPKILEEFYKNSLNYAYWNKYIFPASEKVRREKIFVPRVDEVIKYCDKFNINKNSILEVGAGFGTFCEVMKSKKVFNRVIGIEPTPDLAASCRNKGIEIIEKPIEKVDFPKNELFDVIVNFEVIEHLFSPKDFISQCNRLLKNKGLFIVTCPNGQGFDIATLKTISKTIDHEHLNYFNPKSLELLLKKCGFKVLESLTPGKLDAELVRNEVLANNFDLTNQAFLRKILIDDWETLGMKFQKFLSENMMSSNMWIIAQKEN